MTAPGFPQRQEGIALVIGLVFLLVMTILGVSSLSTTTLEERMASNMQQKTLAFQTSEAAIVRFFNGVNQESTIPLSTADTCSADDTIHNQDINAEVDNEACSDYLGTTDAGRLTDIAFDAQQTSFVHFRIESESRTAGSAAVTINQGIFRLGPRSPSVLVESQ